MSGGLDAIRDALLSRNIAMLSRDVGASTAALDAFMRGDRETLPIEIIDALVAEIWQFTIYDPVLDVLRPVEQPPPRSVGVLPEPYVPTAVYKRDIPRGPQPETPAPKKPKSRPGWLGGWE